MLKLLEVDLHLKFVILKVSLYYTIPTDRSRGHKNPSLLRMIKIKDTKNHTLAYLSNVLTTVKCNWVKHLGEGNTALYKLTSYEIFAYV